MASPLHFSDDTMMSSPPTGTVTFLFTDIESSTKLAQAHPTEWEASRGRHHAILRAAFETHHGHVFQIVGDAFCVSFATAPDALEAALAAQRALHVEAWGETSIRVRMGLHTGAAEARNGDYQGYPTLAQVQRLMSTAYGGQILLSQTTAHLVRGETAGVTLRDMGLHQLKGSAVASAAQTHEMLKDQWLERSGAKIDAFVAVTQRQEALKDQWRSRNP